MTNDILWQTKLHARLHDPAEKALVLLRDPAGHEGGNSRVLWRMARHDAELGDNLDNDNADVLHAVAFSNGVKPQTYKQVQRADWWAAAADRPQWPMQEITVTTKQGEQKTLAVAPWARVNWAKEPVLIHPLTGDQFDMRKHGGLSDTDIDDIKARSFEHFSQLLIREQGKTDFKRSTLAYWRFGSELNEEQDNGTLGMLWRMLPADTRIPDHSIWDHLDLTSAFAGAFAADEQGEVSLLSLALGPVQPFIAAARKMDDLWAGSHLLARLSWEAMRVVCEELGPDAILFPRLRGIPQVDLWLRDQMNLPEALFANCEWNRKANDSNPLFAAALPNRFVALVPSSQAATLAGKIEAQVRQWLFQLGETTVIELLTAAGLQGEQENNSTPFEQMKQQLAGFPEIHWAAVPFSLIKTADVAKQRGLDTLQLSAAMAPFFASESSQPCGFLATPAWQLLQQELQLQDADGKKSVFFAPNPGVLYPAVQDLSERVLAAAKAVRSFAQTEQYGWRCSLTGEAEWITTDRAQLSKSYRQQKDTLWALIADSKPAWAKAGEHLSALPAIKRLWPTLFAREVGRALQTKDQPENIDRFVVSTHSMALAQQMSARLTDDRAMSEAVAEKLQGKPRVALPRKLAKQLYHSEQGKLLARLPGWLDQAREKATDGDESDWLQAQAVVKELFDTKAETYYGLILMDGDNMGAWLAGGENYAISYQQSFHPKVQQGFAEHAKRIPLIKQYGELKRALSPNRHLAISGALNDFSLSVVPYVVEEEFLGRLIYAGGDDVFAMMPVADLLPAMQRLRNAYSGVDPNHQGGRVEHGLSLHQGFAILHNRKLMRMMGSKATASCGAVIAHHQAPLTAVRRELVVAEKRAKQAGRDRFSLTIVKRSGGALYLTERWGAPLQLLHRLRLALQQPNVSRRAVFHTLAWLNEQQLPVPTAPGDMLQSLLQYQLARQGIAKQEAAELAEALTQLTLSWSESERITKLRNFLSVAEFLARETRMGGEQ